MSYWFSDAYRVISVVNTYAWMNATAVSRIVSSIGVTPVTTIFVLDIFIRNLLSKDISKCPAVMFAVSRTHSVIGRIIILMVSTRTIKFISGVGVPWGVM